MLLFSNRIEAGNGCRKVNFKQQVTYSGGSRGQKASGNQDASGSKACLLGDSGHCSPQQKQRQGAAWTIFFSSSSCPAASLSQIKGASRSVKKAFSSSGFLSTGSSGCTLQISPRGKLGRISVGRNLSGSQCCLRNPALVFSRRPKVLQGLVYQRCS